MSRRADDSWRGAHAVLVCGAESIAAIGVIRALGRAGYVVHAVSGAGDALGFRSRFCRASAVHPAPGSPAFLPWLRAYLGANRIGLIIPNEAVLVAMQPAFAEFAPLLACSASPEVVYRGLSKFDVLAELAAAGAAHLPPTVLVENDARAPARERIAALGAPLFVKADAVHARAGDPSITRRAETTEEAQAVLAALSARYRRLVVQGFVPGCGVGAFFLIHRGEVCAEFMHRRLHEVPHTGGVSSLRESWWHAGIRADARAKLKTLAWEGVTMMEYRWDRAHDTFHFVEMNGRFWGSLHLALHAGVDFPRLLADLHFGRDVPPHRGYRLGVRCRHTFPKEVQYVWSRWKDRKLSRVTRWESVLEFAALSLDPRIHSDLSFRSDRRLYWSALSRQVREGLMILGRRFGSGRLSARSANATAQHPRGAL